MYWSSIHVYALFPFIFMEPYQILLSFFYNLQKTKGHAASNREGIPTQISLLPQMYFP